MAKASLKPTRVPEPKAAGRAASVSRTRPASRVCSWAGTSRWVGILMLAGKREVDHHVGITGRVARQYVEPALVGLDDAARDGQAEADARVAGGVEGLGGAAGRVGGKAAAGVAHLD